MALICDLPLLPAPRALVPGQDFKVLHRGHKDWVTRVEHIPGDDHDANMRYSR